MKIRKATAKDIEALAELASRTFITAYDDLELHEAQEYVRTFLSQDAFKSHLELTSSADIFC
jgi:hypothetical protein